MDAFFAAVEQRDDPKLRGRPVVVGGDPYGRGVVSTASYEARKFGVRSAMPAAQARRLCPHAVFLRPNFAKYEAESEKIMAILRQHTELVEPASLDEAYLDVTKNRYRIGDPVTVARLIKQNIHAVTGLSASAGVAPNLFLAKVASDYQKPDGLMVITPARVGSFLENLPVRKIPGVGPVTESRLGARGVKTCGELAGMGLSLLGGEFGKWGVALHDLARGIDDREVEPHGVPKQCGSEETFKIDTKNVPALAALLRDYAQEVFERLEGQGLMGRTVVLKVKYFDFEQITRSVTLAAPPGSWRDVYEAARSLLERKTEAGKKPVRLLGISVSGLKPVREEKRPFPSDLFAGTVPEPFSSPRSSVG